MRLRALSVLLLGLLLAGGSVVLTHNWMNVAGPAPGEAVAVTPDFELAEIVVADADIAFGQAITADLVRMQPWPKSALPADTFTDLAELVGAADGEPRRARRAISAGEPLVAARVSEFGEKITIAGTIDPDKRAIAIRVDDVSGVAGFITPGDRVDIVLTRRLESEGMRTDTILQNVTVRGIDQVADEDRDKPSVVRTVTVEVGADDAQRLALAQQAGTLSLTLRGVADRRTASLPSVKLSELISSALSPKVDRPIVTIHYDESDGTFEGRIMERYGRDGWVCLDDPATGGAATVDGQLTTRTCEKKEPSRRLVLKTRLYRATGQAGPVLADAARFEIWGSSVASPGPPPRPRRAPTADPPTTTAAAPLINVAMPRVRIGKVR